MPTSGRSGERGEAKGDVVARLLLLLLRGDSVLRVRVEGGPFAVRARLEAAPVEVADAVDAALEVDPAGNRRRLPAGGSSEEVDVLSRHAQVDEVGEEAREPRSAGPDDPIGLEPLAVDEHAVSLGRGRPAHEPGAALDRLLGDHPRRVPGAQNARLGLVQDRIEALTVEARKESRSSSGASRSTGIDPLPQDALRLGAPAFVCSA